MKWPIGGFDSAAACGWQAGKNNQRLAGPISDNTSRDHTGLSFQLSVLGVNGDEIQGARLGFKDEKVGGVRSDILPEALELDGIFSRAFTLDAD